ncbi:MAG: hypothetical protein OQL06_11955 [Gammaproteobacteria bacterium]|nr:hypothetical protein [Gammaproteobacteria bacterium]
MTMQFEISEQESKKAKIPHEIFLTNLIFNHILLFVAIISASSLAKYVVIVPVFSVLSLLYLFYGAHRAKTKASWYVNGHWQLCARRSRVFLIMIGIMLTIFGIIWLVSGGNLRPQHWALGGAAFLPTMVTVLVLIIMESEALHHAKIGILPDWVKDRFPEGSLEPLVDEAAAAE